MAIALGALLPAIAGVVAGGASYAGGAAANQANESINNANQAFEISQNINGPSQRVEGLEKAGLNPMLAATGGSAFGGYPNPGTQSMQNPLAGTAQALQQIPMQIAQTRLTNAQAAQIENATPGSDVLPLALNSDGTPKTDANGMPIVDWQTYMTTGAHSMGNMTAMTGAQNIQNLQAAYQAIGQTVKTQASQQNLNDMQAAMTSLTMDQKTKLFNTTLAAAKADLNISQNEAATTDPDAAIYGSKWGTALRVLQMLIHGTGQAGNAGRAIGAIQ